MSIRFQRAVTTAKRLVFLEDSEAFVEVPHNHELVCKAFVRHDAALPSSTCVERVFSVTADVFTKKRGKTTDENFQRRTAVGASQGDKNK